MLLHCLYFEGQNNKLLILITNNNLPPSLAKFSPKNRKQGINNKCWPNKQTSTSLQAIPKARIQSACSLTNCKA